MRSGGIFQDASATQKQFFSFQIPAFRIFPVHVKQKASSKANSYAVHVWLQAEWERATKNPVRGRRPFEHLHPAILRARQTRSGALLREPQSTGSTALSFIPSGSSWNMVRAGQSWAHICIHLEVWGRHPSPCAHTGPGPTDLNTRKMVWKFSKVRPA